jgi:hypothetical protein
MKIKTQNFQKTIIEPCFQIPSTDGSQSIKKQIKHAVKPRGPVIGTAKAL